MERIWILQTAHLGDAILTLPFLARLLEARPHAQITIICRPSTQSIFTLALDRSLSTHRRSEKASDSFPHRHRVTIVPYDKSSTFGFVRRLRAEGGDPSTAFCVQRSFRSALIAWLSGAKVRVGFSSGAPALFYTHAVRRPWESGLSEVEKNLNLLRAVEAHVPAWDTRHAPSLLLPPNVPKREGIALSLGSPWATKRWPVENAAEFVNKATRDGQTVTLVGDDATRPLAAELRALCPSLLVKDLTGQTPIREWIDVLASSQLVVSGDSAAVHAAADLNVPVIALFGPTLPEFGFAPWRRNSLALGLDNLPCRPCHIHGPKVCPLGHHKCLKEMRGDQVSHAAEVLLAR